MRIIRNLLIIGACILVWLILLTPVAVGIYAAADNNGTSQNSTPTYDRSYTDAYGYNCEKVVADSSGRCPSNPFYGE